MSPTRPKLNIVDDPVTRGGHERPVSPPSASPRRSASSSTPATVAAAAETAPLVPQTPAQDTERAQASENSSQRERYSEEPKKAVFGRVPRSLSRRLERAVVELREDTDDLTQEQLLAALLYKYVDPADGENLSALAATVNEYRSRL